MTVEQAGARALGAMNAAIPLAVSRCQFLWAPRGTLAQESPRISLDIDLARFRQLLSLHALLRGAEAGAPGAARTAIPVLVSQGRRATSLSPVPVECPSLPEHRAFSD